MKTDKTQLKHPFGEISCEKEVKLLRDSYKDYFFEHTQFNSQALDPDAYLIVGRRGAGSPHLLTTSPFKTLSLRPDVSTLTNPTSTNRYSARSPHRLR